ncbi:DMT family transporter [Microvirga sp. W0021]|uniref:DMT family transporter n=1 Tax=Hohaiivirga grylli TaxID=3133970 RepID=A0ABV0BHZ9_9HYPH
MNKTIIKANFLLLFTATIWGSTFVAQKAAMEYIGPFWYTGLRFLLGFITVLPLVFFERPAPEPDRKAWLTGVGIGLFLFVGINLQQVALMFTSVTNSGFITGLYVVLVPIISIFAGYRYGMGVWVGVALAVTGLYLLSIHGALEINYGDLLTLLSAFFWAFQVLALSSSKNLLPPVRLALTQFAVCMIPSLLIAAVIEPISFEAIGDAGFSLLYGGILSVGFGFTMQVLAQRYTPAAHSAIILSLESVFAALTGWLVLGDIMDARVLTGCALMLTGTILAQLSPAKPLVMKSADKALPESVA